MSNFNNRNPADIHLSAEEQRLFDRFAVVDQAVLTAEERPLLTSLGLVDPFPDAEYGDGQAFLMSISALGKQLRSLQHEQRMDRLDNYEQWLRNMEIARAGAKAAIASAIAAGCSAVISLASLVYALMR